LSVFERFPVPAVCCQGFCIQSTNVSFFCLMTRHILNSQDLLHAAVLKYQQVPAFQQSLMQISNTHRARLEKVGFSDSN